MSGDDAVMVGNYYDHEDAALGCVRMPPGYLLVRVDDHWMWVHPETDRESCIHWDRWAIYRGAAEDARKRVMP